MKKQHLRRISLISLLAILASAIAAAQQPRASLPAVTAAAVPIYPIGPHTVNIQGVVRIKVSTDGHRVTRVAVEDDNGNPALARAAQENARTWRFANHEPIAFTVTYRYILVASLPDIQSNALNSKVVLRFPTDVEVYAQRWPGTVDVPAEVK